MSIERACACGHVFRLEKAPPGTVCVCPQCGAVTRFDDPPARKAAPPTAGKTLKPLWSVMGQSAPAEPPPTESKSVEPSRPKGLWNVMGSAPAPAATSPPPQPTAPLPREKVESPPPLPSPLTPSSSAPASPAPQPVVTPSELIVENAADDALEFADIPAPQTATTIRTGQSTQAVWSAALGGVSLALSFLSFVPAFWSKFPAMIVGFVALLLGFFAATEIRQSRGRQTGSGLAVDGIVCGIMGMFLGPLFIAPRAKPPSRPAKKTAVVQPQRFDA